MLPRMSLCVYCHRRHMGNHAYQIWYKLYMLAEIKTPVKFICIMSLGKAPNSTINNIIPCSLSVLCHWYVILSISGFCKSYLLPYRNPSQQPYFPSESYLIQVDQKEKRAPFPLQPSPSKSEVCALACELLWKPPPLLPRQGREQSRQQGIIPLQRASSNL